MKVSDYIRDAQISVIVPVYNAQNKVGACIESILQQTFVDFHLIMVDDGSKDNSLKVCQEYAAKDDRITVFHQENKGPGAARNAGLELAKSSFVTFVDADDTILPSHLQTLIDAIDNNTDVVWSSYLEVDLKGMERVVSHGYEDNKILSQKEFCQSFFDGRSGLGALWNKIYRRSFIGQHNLSFETDRVNAEDWHFNLSLCLADAKVKTIQKPTYCYVRDINSITNTFRPNDWIYKIRSYERLAAIDIDVEKTAYEERTVNELLTQVLQNAAHGYDALPIVEALRRSNVCRILLTKSNIYPLPMAHCILLRLIQSNHEVVINAYLKVIFICHKLKKSIF
jgi:glycosyltransferase involved in cell wall biosynthesis